MSGTTTPQAVVFECFQCGLPCQIDPKLGVGALPKNMVLIPPPSGFSTDAANTVDMSTAAATKPTQSRQLVSKHSIEHISSRQPTAKLLQHQSSQEESSLIHVDEDC